jgi:NitT/TauT family transport system substrate-binding protein
MLLRRLLPVLAAVALLITAAPQRAPAAGDAPDSVTVAYQPGIGYSTLIIVKQSGALERRFPGTKFEWKVFTNGDAIRDGIIAKQIQIGAGGNGPFLIGWDRGVGYRLIASMNEMNLWLVSRDPKFKSLRDLQPGMQIGMPSPDAVQAIALRKAAKDLFGDAHKFDANIVAIAHPLGVQALAAGQLEGHLSSPPFEQQEVAAGGHVVFRSYEAFGKSTFNSVYTTEEFNKQYPRFVNVLFDELRSANDMLNKNPEQAAALLSKDTGGKQSTAQFREWITSPDITWDTTPHAFLRTAAFMKEIGMLNKVPANIREIEFPFLKGGD